MKYEFEALRVSGDGSGIVTVTIDRPKALNALNDALIRAIQHCFSQLAEDPEARVVIVAGSGEKAFIAGADVSELASQGREEARRRARAGQAAFDQIERLGKPVIAAIHGYALGGGLELALACHLRYASSNSRLGLPEVTLGIIPGYGGTQRLQRVAGRGVAMEWVLSGEMVSAEEALRRGVLNGVCSAEELHAKVQSVAKTLLSRGPLALRHALDAMLRGGDMPLAQGLAVEAELFGTVSETQDMKEGMKAFLEKRKPNFRGV